MGPCRNDTAPPPSSPCAALLTGCAFSRGELGTAIKPEVIAQIKKDEATDTQVVALLGAPDEIRQLGKREVFLKPDQLVAAGDGFAVNYFYRDAKYFRVNFGWPLGFVSPTTYLPHDLVLENSASGADRFQVAFDSGAVVRYAGFFRGAAAAQYKAWPFEGTK